jgi:hypothetical protein
MNSTEEFIENYKNKIQDLLSMPSGQHEVDKERLNEWINAQASIRRRETARILSEHIRYITHSELITKCKELVNKMYNDPTNPIPIENTLKWFVGPKNKSAYFIGILCYHFAKELNYRLPEVILSPSLKYNEFDKSTTFYLDDMSYSGSQIYQLLQKIYVTSAKSSEEYVNKKKAINLDVVKEKYIDLRIGICFITERAKNQLDNFNFNSTVFSHGAYATHLIPNPYKRYYSEIIADLNSILDPQIYTDTLIYFNPFRDSSCICYFDHKLADSNSTFTNLLRFGQVPPTKIDFSFIYKHEDRKLSKYKRYYNQHTDVCDKDLTEIEFIPFIKGCNEIDEKFKEKLKKLPYHIFMMTLSGEKEENGENSEYSFYEIKTNYELFNYKNSVDKRCPHSWYKNAYFTGGTRRLRKRKTRRRK